MHTRCGTLLELADAIRQTTEPITEHWAEVNKRFQDWVGQPALRTMLRAHLSELSPAERAALGARSRETTTHFAWCLAQEPTQEFSIWLHEYKPQSDWREGYADSVHNHRYHFCTTILAGAYTHQRYTAALTPDGCAIDSVCLQRSTHCPAGTGGYLLDNEFHRIPDAADGTVTLLVKSRQLRPWSLSFDPNTQHSYRHVPVQNRLPGLLARL